MASPQPVAASSEPVNLTQWVCKLAAANQSRANCSECTWWRQPDLTHRALHRPPTVQPATTAWFMCLHKANSSREIAFFDYVRVAVLSAKLNAPSLAPYVLYIHGVHEPFAQQDDNVTVWLKSMGVRVLNSRLSFLNHMPKRRWRMERTTGICKMDIPFAARAHEHELVARGLDPERILMTDADVLFANDFSYARWPRARRLRTFAAGIEFFSKSLNSGVVYFNVSTMLAEWPRMLQYAVTKKFNFLVADQSWLQEWYDLSLGKGRRAATTGWDRLDESIFNARPFAHPWRGHPMLKRRLRWHEPHIWHWHGYKPNDVACWLNAMATGKWPLRGWRETPGCARGGHVRAAAGVEAGVCQYRPIKDTGCRYLGRIRHTKCYLRTVSGEEARTRGAGWRGGAVSHGRRFGSRRQYTYLLMEHRKLLRLANQEGAWWRGAQT